jgi:hypothetical protein
MWKMKKAKKVGYGRVVNGKALPVDKEEKEAKKDPDFFFEIFF